jgi:hypothetical protein
MMSTTYMTLHAQYMCSMQLHEFIKQPLRADRGGMRRNTTLLAFSTEQGPSRACLSTFQLNGMGKPPVEINRVPPAGGQCTSQLASNPNLGPPSALSGALRCRAAPVTGTKGEKRGRVTDIHISIHFQLCVFCLRTTVHAVHAHAQALPCLAIIMLEYSTAVVYGPADCNPSKPLL